MRHTIFMLFFLAAAFQAKAQHSYLSSDSLVVIKSGDIAQYDSPNIVLVAVRYFAFDEAFVATIGVADTGATTDFAANLDIPLAQADVDALTGSGATETRTLLNAVLQALQGYFEALNPGVTFTLN